MYKENDYLVYKNDVCKIREIKKNKINGKEYYVLIPINDESLTIEVPIDNKLGYIRSLISKEGAEKLIKKIPQIELLSNVDDKYIEKVYKDLLYNGSLEDLVKIIKTSYIRNDNRIKNNKKTSDKDTSFFDKAEKHLYSELSIALNLNLEEVKKYIISKVQNSVE